jgi:hypothetical protein
MRQSLFAGLRLRASYRGISSDYVIALLSRVDDSDADPFFDSCCLHQARRRTRPVPGKRY